jgi:hypothetical protein
MGNNNKKNLLNRIEKISEAAEESNLELEDLSLILEEIQDISKFLNISDIQSVLFSCLINLSIQKHVTLENLSRKLKCSALKIISYMDEIDSLINKNLLQKRYRSKKQRYSYNDIAYTVPHNVIEALRTSDKSKLITTVKFDLPDFLEYISEIMNERGEDRLSTRQLADEVEFVISNNCNNRFIKFVSNNILNTVHKFLVFFLAYCRLKGDDETLIEYFAPRLFDDLTEQIKFMQSISNGQNELVKGGYICMKESGFMDDKVISLAPKVVKVLYEDYPELYIEEETDNRLIKPEVLKDKELFFNPELETQIDEITRVLTKEKFTYYKNQLQESRLNKGITAIFYGNSGTGKTEAVYQIARKTNRKLFMIDLSQVRSKWFGESEKQVKKIFDDYRQLLRNSDMEPIMFINEADGLFSRRLKISDNGSSTEQAVNTMQNIMLQEMENFEGILIATTNLTCNLDSAFERRFIFKIEFPRPDKTIRQKIWKSKLPELTTSIADELAKRFELTGGEIDIQIRQFLLKKVLNKKVNAYQALMESCKKVKGLTTKSKVGF